MTTVQIVGIVVAAAIVLLLIIALLVTRRRGSTSEEPPAETSHASFLDDAPQDTLSGLGKAEHPVEDVTIDPDRPRWDRSTGEDAVLAPPVAAGAEVPEGNRLALGGGPSGDVQAADAIAAAAGAAASPAAPAHDETTDELPAARTPATTTTTPSPATESGGFADDRVPARPAEGGSAASKEAAPESGAGGRRVPLSDIIVTTSNKMVDLQDPEVRRMLTDLVKDELDQATHYRQQGQTIDAVLQLTEAEKISRALDMRGSAAAIHKMLQDLQGQA
jgi:pyruvate/2-oxoglutarate dehydrogenase complex dihydrolipoamide acyltransferase (E2) component